MTKLVTDDRGAAGPVTFAGGVLDRYRHVCAFVNGREQEDAVLDPFVQQAVEHGERLLYLVDPAESGAPINQLRHLGYDAGELLQGNRCEVRTWTDTYLRDGRFDPSAMLALLEGMFTQESPRIRMVADMDWAIDRVDDAANLIEFEARANFIHARHNHVVICSYDATKFDGAFIIDILRTHPMVLINGMLQENPFFLPPSEFVKERSRFRAR